MQKTALIFLAGILIPSGVLGWLAWRTVGQQQVILERQAAELYQGETDALAARVREWVFGRQEEFNGTVRALLASDSASDLARHFDEKVRGIFPGGVAFVVASNGSLVTPSRVTAAKDSSAQKFIEGNQAFLTNESQVELYKAKTGTPVPQSAPTAPGAGEAESGLARQEVTRDQMLKQKETPVGGTVTETGSAGARGAESQGQNLRNVAPSQFGYWDKNEPQPSRKVLPEKLTSEDIKSQAPASKLAPELSGFLAAVEWGREGVITRFVQDELEVIFWIKSPGNPEYVFGLMIPAASMGADIQKAALVSRAGGRLAWASYDGSGHDICLAVLNEKGRPVLRSPDGVELDWKRPFVATEIGEALPYWEATLYLMNPDALTASARTARLTILSLIILALAAILFAGWFVTADTRRQLILAQKKSDFVSNVSHELKTPLTSIRMFSELLQDGKAGAEKQSKYLRIITLEAERLTRLINNVLDFARIEKGHPCERREVDLFPLVRRVWEAQSAHLIEAGFSVEWEADSGPYWLFADEDAIAQVLVNLLSNAEKYCGDRREAKLETRSSGGGLVIQVLDRGPGVPRGEERRIFEAFHRANDSLASGVQGSGLGLTLARRIVEAHGGTLEYSDREGGGSIFTARLPGIKEPK